MPYKTTLWIFNVVREMPSSVVKKVTKENMTGKIVFSLSYVGYTYECDVDRQQWMADLQKGRCCALWWISSHHLNKASLSGGGSLSDDFGVLFVGGSIWRLCLETAAVITPGPCATSPKLMAPGKQGNIPWPCHEWKHKEFEWFFVIWGNTYIPQKTLTRLNDIVKSYLKLQGGPFS